MARKLVLSRRAPEAADRPSTTIVRLSRNQSYECTVLSDDVTGAEIHWLGRTIPHTTPSSDCEGCLKARPIKWEGYLSVWQERTNAFAILPLNPGCDQQCQAYLEDHGTLRGAVVHAGRVSLKSNAAVTLSLMRGERAINTLPAPVDITRVLLHMWGLTNASGIEIIKAIGAESVTVPFEDSGSDSVDDLIPTSLNGRGGAA